MKCLAIAASALVVTHAFGQGIVNFYNRNLVDTAAGREYHAPVSLPDGTKVGSSFTAGLFVARTSGLELIATTPFNDGATAGFFAINADVTVPGIPPFSPATFHARVWETSAGSYENAVANGRYYGEFLTASGTPDLFIPELGMPHAPGGQAMPNMSGIQPLTLIPESKAIALLAFAAVVLISIGGTKHNKQTRDRL